MFAMVYEFRDPRTAAIPSKQRDTFRKNQRSHRRLGNLDCEDKPQPMERSHHARCRNPLRGEAFTTQRKAPPSNHDRCDRQSNSYYFPPELDMSMPEIEEYGSALGLTRIWPTTETPPHCPVRVLFDADAENVAYSLINVLAKVYGIQPLVPVRN